jgi:hypothetical protein
MRKLYSLLECTEDKRHQESFRFRCMHFEWYTVVLQDRYHTTTWRITARLAQHVTAALSMGARCVPP